MKKIHKRSKFQSTKINPKRFHPSQVRYLLFLFPLALFMLLPLVYIFNHAFKPLEELFYYPPRFFVNNPTLENFRRLFELTGVSGIPMSRYLFNSIVVTVLVLFFSVLIATLAGYALSKLAFKGKKIMNEINTLALMFVGVAVMIPRYLVVEQLGLIDNFFVHVLPYLAIPVGLFLVKQFIDQIPNELIDASRVDGANEWQIYVKIIIPLIKPAIATIVILSFQAVWNSADTSQTYINQDSLKTFAFYMGTLTNNTNGVAGQGMGAAASLIMFVPNLVIFILMQSKVMDTMAHSGIK
ncbi:MAG: carbohydrate ABC transporter permease [Candidatus Izemoplasmatales bacterium]|jgi:ABC-type glycerol-3-phosphate transport system permease component|nr:carbohydrate ABC transporter permease [bacterium]MDZ4195872.1 carbohydrate ABC transporter permease [Candidatus Izemoplasmatales bacterium]